MTTTSLPAPKIERVRRDIVRRALTVTAKEMLTPHMIRLTLSSPDLSTFESTSFDDHIKLIFAGDGDEKIMREYTPRRFDTEKCELVIDFAVHEAGPATKWAVEAEVGSVLNIAGPRGSKTITGEIGQWVLVGDETSLPAIGRFAEEAAEGTKVTVICAVRDAADEQGFDTKAEMSVTWVHRSEAQATDPHPVLDALEQVELPEGTFVWTASEAGITKAVRAYLTDKGHPLVWMRCAGYWTKGAADASLKFDD